MNLEEEQDQLSQWLTDVADEAITRFVGRNRELDERYSDALNLIYDAARVGVAIATNEPVDKNYLRPRVGEVRSRIDKIETRDL